MSQPSVITFTSPYDQTTRSLLLQVPPSCQGEPLPLVIAPHPMTFTAQDDYENGVEGMKLPHKGWRGVAERYNVLVAQPFGHGRVSDTSCLAFEGQMRDLAALPGVVEDAGYRVDRERLYACGLSMGAMEVATFLGLYPDLLAAAFVFNGVFDLVALYADLSASPWAEIREAGHVALIEEEVGGTPAQLPEEYARRSAITYAARMTRTPFMIYWSHLDPIVPHGDTQQGKHLYDLIKQADPLAPVVEYNHTISHGHTVFDLDNCWRLHEYSDYDLAVRWLLCHRRPAGRPLVVSLPQ